VGVQRSSNRQKFAAGLLALMKKCGITEIAWRSGNEVLCYDERGDRMFAFSRIALDSGHDIKESVPKAE
jgi:hypothetical protein